VAAIHNKRITAGNNKNVLHPWFRVITLTVLLLLAWTSITQVDKYLSRCFLQIWNLIQTLKTFEHRERLRLILRCRKFIYVVLRDVLHGVVQEHFHCPCNKICDDLSAKRLLLVSSVYLGLTGKLTPGVVCLLIVWCGYKVVVEQCVVLTLKQLELASYSSIYFKVF